MYYPGDRLLRRAHHRLDDRFESKTKFKEKEEDTTNIFLFSFFQTNLGNLMGPGSSVLGSAEQNAHSLSTVSATSCGVSMGPANNGIYTSDTSASMLGCLLPSLPSLPSLSSPHDVFRHGEMLRAYHDPSRQHARHLQRTDVT